MDVIILLLLNLINVMFQMRFDSVFDGVILITPMMACTCNLFLVPMVVLHYLIFKRVEV